MINKTDKDPDETSTGWQKESKSLAVKSSSRIWLLAAVIVPFFSFFEYNYDYDQFKHFLSIFLTVSGLMLLTILIQKKIQLPTLLQIYGVSVILAGCFGYMAAKTNIDNVQNYLMGVSAITLVRGILYFGKVIHLIIVTLINHAIAFLLIFLFRQESFLQITDIESTLFFGIIFMIFSFVGMNTRYKLTKENFIKSNNIKTSLEIIEHQKQVVEEKQKEILDSIYYSKRIQTALLPNEKYIEKNLNQLKKT